LLQRLDREPAAGLFADLDAPRVVHINVKDRQFLGDTKKLAGISGSEPASSERGANGRVRLAQLPLHAPGVGIVCTQVVASAARLNFAAQSQPLMLDRLLESTGRLLKLRRLFPSDAQVVEHSPERALVAPIVWKLLDQLLLQLDCLLECRDGGVRLPIAVKKLAQVVVAPCQTALPGAIGRPASGHLALHFDRLLVAALGLSRIAQAPLRTA
jgi:hypothetical protein